MQCEVDTDNVNIKCHLKYKMIFTLKQQLIKLTSFNFSIEDTDELFKDILQIDNSLHKLNTYQKPITVSDYYHKHILSHE